MSLIMLIFIDCDSETPDYDRLNYDEYAACIVLKKGNIVNVLTS